MRFGLVINSESASWNWHVISSCWSSVAVLSLAVTPSMVNQEYHTASWHMRRAWHLIICRSTRLQSQHSTSKLYSVITICEHMRPFSDLAQVLAECRMHLESHDGCTS